MEIEYNTKGKKSGTKIEKKFDVVIGFSNITYQYQFPMCSVVKFELNPVDQQQFFCGGKLTVLMRYTVSQDYTHFHTVHKQFFIKSCWLFLWQNKTPTLDGNRTNPIAVYQNCNLLDCTCQGKHDNPLPQTNPLQTQYLPKVGTGDKPKMKEVSKVGMGDKPNNKGSAQGGDGGQTQNKGGCLRWGQGTNPKQRRCPRWGWGKNPKPKDLPNVEMGDKPKKNEVPKVINQEIAKEFCPPS